MIGVVHPGELTGEGPVQHELLLKHDMTCARGRNAHLDELRGDHGDGRYHHHRHGSQGF